MRIRVDPERPAPRSLAPVGDILRRDGVIIYPTDTGYAFGCAISSHRAVDTLRRIKGISAKEKKPFAILVSGLDELAKFGHMDNRSFRAIRRLLPGPYTIVLPSSSQLPRPLRNRGKEVGLRIADHRICSMLLDALEEPLITSSVRAADEPELEEPDLLFERHQHEIDALIDCGPIWPEPSTVLRMNDSELEVLREGQGSLPAELESARRQNLEPWREL